ncbi:MAG: enolase, partial [Synergistaceae bacterium]|nr:enolase [Synergistaceae bacterium]
MTEIANIFLRTILDSRGNPTVEAEIFTISGGFGRACAPSGASTGIYEAKVRPSDEAIFEAGEHLIPRLIELDSADQRGFDETLHEIDGTSDLSK